MRTAIMLLTALVAISGSAVAQSYDGYDAFYAAQPGAVFNVPIDHTYSATEPNTQEVYSYPGKAGHFSQLHASIGRKAVRMELWQNRIVVAGTSFRFSRSRAFPNEQATYIFPESGEVFIAQRTNAHPPLLCVQGHAAASGEASSRYQQIFLVIDPLARKPTFLQLPGWLSSCLAVLMTNSGQLAYPETSYLYDDAKQARVGLLLRYYTFDGKRFIPIDETRRLKFVEPENPFQFSVEGDASGRRNVDMK